MRGHTGSTGLAATIGTRRFAATGSHGYGDGSLTAFRLAVRLADLLRDRR
jgi:hypothetical protein